MGRGGRKKKRGKKAECEINSRICGSGTSREPENGAASAAAEFRLAENNQEFRRTIANGREIGCTYSRVAFHSRSIVNSILG